MISPNVVWHAGAPRDRRWRAIDTVGATVWFTGRPASGKSTCAGTLESALLDRGRSAYMLDGDNLRHGLNANLGFDRQARRENVRRTAHLARALADSGTVALVSLVSPYAADRELARAIHAVDGLAFIEVYVNTPPAECMRRDPKGLYARASAGEIENFTGVDSPYEAPRHPDLEIVPDQPIEEQVEQLIALLDAWEK